METQFGICDSAKMYTCQYLAVNFFGLSVSKAREILRDNFECVEVGNGVILISGRNLMAGLERMSKAPGGTDDETGATPQELNRRRYPSSNGKAKATRRRGTKEA